MSKQVESSLAERVAKWEKFWRDYLRQVTAIVTPNDEHEAWTLINQRGREIAALINEARQPLQGTLYDPEIEPTLYGPRGVFTTADQAEPLDPRQVIRLDTYYTSMKLFEIWQHQMLKQGNRTAVQLALDIQKSWSRFHKEAEPVLIYNLLTLLGHHEDAYAFAAAVKTPAYIKTGSRTDIAMRREAAGRLERENIKDTLRGDLPGTIAELPHHTMMDVEVEGAKMRLTLSRPLLPTTPEGLDDFNLGVKQVKNGREFRRSPTGLVVDLVGLPEPVTPPEFDLDEKPGPVLEDPLQAMLLDEDESEKEERLERALAAYNQLTEKQQEAFRAQMQGKSRAEIGKAAGITEESVKDRLESAKKSLKKKLG